MTAFARFPWLVMRAAWNPATIITVFAPMFIIASEAFFRSNSGEPYISLLKSKEVCGLLDHRTQMYTLMVAFVFLMVQTGAIVLRRLKTTAGTIDIRRQDAFPGYCLLFMLVSGVLFIGTVLTGHLMTFDVVEQYSNLPGCLGGNAGAMQLPPMASPITILRVSTGFAGIVISYYDMRIA